MFFSHNLFMKKLLVLLLLFSGLYSTAQESLNMSLLGHWDDDSLPTASPGNLNLQYSGCWAMAINGSEIAVLGGARHVLFFDITNPAQPELIGKFLGTATTVWREMKSYKNRIYAVSDNTTEGMMIFDLSQAPDTIIQTYWSNAIFNNSHTITLDTVSGRIYLNGSNLGTVGILDVSQNPDAPQLLNGTFLPGNYIHDSYVRNDTLYASSGFDGYFVHDLTDPLNPVTLASATTGGYNHNSWLSADGHYAYYTEEIPAGKPIRIVDLQGLSDPMPEIEVIGGFLDNLTAGAPPSAIPHNVYIKDTLLFNSQYEDGLLVYSIADPINPVLIAYYDTHPQNVGQYKGYYGNWGNYPWLPSGTIVAGDMQNGLFLLQLGASVSVGQPVQKLDVLLSPNPASDVLRVQVPMADGGWSYQLFNTAGVSLRQGYQLGNDAVEIARQNLSDGFYFIKISDEKGNQTTKKVVFN